MFRRLREITRDKTIDKLYAHFVSLGIDAEIVEEGAPEDIGATSLFVPLGRLGIQHPLKGTISDMGSIRVNGKAVEVIQVARYLRLDSESPTGPRYEIDYAIRSHVKENEERFTAKTKTKRKGLFRKQIVGFTWTGGDIADLLNEDPSLKELMLHQQILNYLDVEIKPDKKKPYVRIHPGHGAFPSEKAFDCYDTIARHLRTLLR